MISEQELDEHCGSPAGDAAFAGLEAFSAVDRALEAEAKRLRTLRDSVESVEAAIRASEVAARHLQVPLKVYDEAEAAIRAADERVSQVQAAVSEINAHRRFIADLLMNLTEFVERESVRTLMQHGWFPDQGLTIPEIRWLAEMFAADAEIARLALCARFQDLLNDIEERATGAFPNRSEILREAFHAHRQGHYHLSVLAFLKQVDGFFHDRWDTSLFTTAARKDVKSRIGKIQNNLARDMVRVLLDSDWPLIMAKGTRPKGFTGLNRHQVLHGEVTNYGTEENSLRALSLLNYCAFVLPKPEQKPTDTNGSK
ncbi:MAG: hypothetical protein F4010_01550 [Cenarchaeum sp. SB0669_bin_11]|nr:hypothetical protein [Acidimicrobiaceae bacterium]MYL10841.1 hypothetical protein [Cenarchaeum sp. SB0669_bin_11]